MSEIKILYPYQEALIDSIMNGHSLVSYEAMRRHEKIRRSNILTQATMLKMKVGETLALCSPEKVLIFKCVEEKINK